jgi:hypothetical protein
MDNNVFAIIEEKKNKSVEKIKNGAQKYLIIVVLLFNIALVVVSRLYRFGFKNPFSAEFFLELAITMTTTMICYMCFVPFGKTEEEKRNLEFPKIVKLWQELSTKVRTGFLQAFGLFCEQQVADERNEAKKLIIDNNTVIPFEIYKEKYEPLSKKQLKSLLNEEKLSKKEYKAILRANGYGLFSPVKIKRINPVIILSGARKSSVNDAGRTDTSYVARWLTTRPLVMFISTAILNSIATTFIGGGSNAILDMFIAVFQIIIAAVFGYSAGVSEFRHNLDKINSRVIFLSLFCEKNKIQTKTPSI